MKLKISKKMSRKQFAAAVVEQLSRFDISCVLVGGSCLSIYTNERHRSHDLDFISPSSIGDISAALAEIGFERSGRYFKHQSSKFYVEFPTGPISIGNETDIKPRGILKVGRTVVRMLSPSQSVMDRLAAWYYWNDRRSLIHAIWICDAQPVSFTKLKAWSKAEGQTERYEEFVRQLKSHRQEQRAKFQKPKSP